MLASIQSLHYLLATSISSFLPPASFYGLHLCFLLNMVNTYGHLLPVSLNLASSTTSQSFLSWAYSFGKPLSHRDQASSRTESRLSMVGFLDEFASSHLKATEKGKGCWIWRKFDYCASGMCWLIYASIRSHTTIQTIGQASPFRLGTLCSYLLYSPDCLWIIVWIFSFCHFIDWRVNIIYLATQRMVALAHWSLSFFYAQWHISGRLSPTQTFVGQSSPPSHPLLFFNCYCTWALVL